MADTVLLFYFYFLSLFNYIKQVVMYCWLITRQVSDTVMLSFLNCIGSYTVYFQNTFSFQNKISYVLYLSMDFTLNDNWGYKLSEQ